MSGLARERYITAAELARAMGVSHSTIKRWTREGMPSEDWGMRHVRRYLASACIEWARSRADSMTTPSRGAGTPQGPTPQGESCG
jgi:hypothetical protein